METHLESKDGLMNVAQEQTESLKQVPIQNTLEIQHRNEKSEKAKCEKSFRFGLKRISWYQFVLAIIILVFIFIFCSEMLIYYKRNIERKDNYLNNLELLKLQGTFKVKESSLKVSQSLQKVESKKQKLALEIKQLGKQNNAKQSHQEINQNKQSEKGAQSNNVQNKNQVKTLKIENQEQNIVKNKLLLQHKQRSYKIKGSGIYSDLLQKARSRLHLLNQDINISSKVSQQQLKYFEDKYQISKYDQLPICVVIPTYNNAPNNRYLDNIKSIIMQNYSNFHIIIIDDASTDNTGSLILNYLQRQQKVSSDRYSIIRNTQQMHTMFNLRFAAKNYCKPNDIFIVVDGDDYLVGRQVFKLYNAKFQADDLWFMYTNFINTEGKVGYSRPFPLKIIQTNRYRDYPFVTSHLRAFYTKLFLNIRQEDLKDENGNFLKAANDVAICIPVLEQAHLHIQYVPEITYYYNSNTGLNNHAIRLQQQKFNDRKIRKRRRYSELKSFM